MYSTKRPFFASNLRQVPLRSSASRIRQVNSTPKDVNHFCGSYKVEDQCKYSIDKFSNDLPLSPYTDPLQLFLRAMFTPIAIVAGILSVVSLIGATPTRRDVSDAFCQQLFTDCVNVGPNVVSNPWATPACIYGATCFGGSRPVDDFLASVASSLNTTFEASLDVPRVSSAVRVIVIPFDHRTQILNRYLTKSARTGKLSHSKTTSTEFSVPWPPPTGHSLMLLSSFHPTNESLFGRTSATPTVFHSKTSPIISNSLPQSALLDALLQVLEQPAPLILVNCVSNSPIPIPSQINLESRHTNTNTIESTHY